MTDAPQSVPALKANSPTFAEFLTETPLLAVRPVQVSPTAQHGNYGVRHSIKLPVLQLHCPHKTCQGTRHFDPADGDGLFLGRFKPNEWFDQLVDYVCRNCRRTQKTYAVRYRLAALDAKVTEMVKFGEIPAFGDPRPNVIRDVLDDEILYFERGYRAETAGLGIGAFAYYRRFVESHKDKIIAEIRKVAVAQGAKQDVLDTLDKAAKMNSFENAVRTVKDAIPDSLRHSGGHNPLTLLHDALSAGLHNEDDEQCLELAKDIRLLLTDLAERTTQALKNDSELGQAVNRLLQKASARASGKQGA
jgi:hypothetical protein